MSSCQFSHSYCLYEDSNEAPLMVGGLYSFPPHSCIFPALALLALQLCQKPHSSLLEIGRVNVSQHPQSCLCLVFSVALTRRLRFPWNRFVQWKGAVALRLCWINTWSNQLRRGTCVCKGPDFRVRRGWRDVLRWITIVWVRGGGPTCLSGEDISQVCLQAWRNIWGSKETIRERTNCRILWHRSTSAGVASPVDVACV